MATFCSTTFSAPASMIYRPKSIRPHFAQERAEELRVAGRIAYVATLGGSSPIGCVGYADCALGIQTLVN